MTGESSASNADLERAVAVQLHWDPRVDDAAIVVSARDGEVTLRGSVGTFGEKREARRAAERVHGVRSLKNELTVRLRTKHVEVDVSPTNPRTIDVDHSVDKALRNAGQAITDLLPDDY